MPYRSPTPTNEPERIAALQRYEILDTPADGSFDRITALASRLLGTPIAIVSLVDVDRIWFKSHHGLPVQQIDREPGLCASAILGDGAYVLNDALTDPRSMANPLVAGEFGLRFYAGVPLRTQDHHNLGVLCCLDFQPRELTAAEQRTLQDLADLVMDQMELRLAARKVDVLHQRLKVAHEELGHQASHDALTGLWNRKAILTLMEQVRARARRHASPMAAMMLDVDFFKKVNDTYGHQAGDRVLVAVARRLHGALRANDTIGRMGGEEFLAVLEDCSVENAAIVAERCRRAVCDLPVVVDDTTGQTIQVSISIGLSHVDVGDLSAEQVVASADMALYDAKHGGRNRVSARQI